MFFEVLSLTLNAYTHKIVEIQLKSLSQNRVYSTESLFLRWTCPTDELSKTLKINRNFSNASGKKIKTRPIALISFLAN